MSGPADCVCWPGDGTCADMLAGKLCAQGCPTCNAVATCVADISRELARAAKRYPDCVRLPDGVATSHARETYRKMAQAWCDRAYREGILTHADVYEEEVAEVLDARSLAELRKELVQVGAMTLKWLLHVDERLAAGETSTVASNDKPKGDADGR